MGSRDPSGDRGFRWWRPLWPSKVKPPTKHDRRTEPAPAAVPVAAARGYRLVCVMPENTCTRITMRRTGSRGSAAASCPQCATPGVIDLAERVSDEESFATARRLIREEGLLVGGSSGTAVAAALRVAARVQWSGRRPAGRLVGSIFIPPVAPSGGLNGAFARRRGGGGSDALRLVTSNAQVLEHLFQAVVTE
jgi:hypothetical protein